MCGYQIKNQKASNFQAHYNHERLLYAHLEYSMQKGCSSGSSLRVLLRESTLNALDRL